MIDFDQAAMFSEILHYILVIGVCITILYKSYKNFINLVIKVYLMFFIWGILCYICGGCPITILENKVSTAYFGKPFYPDYKFTNSDFYYLVTHIEFYIPVSMVTLILINKYIKNGTSITSPFEFSSRTTTKSTK